jgi:hypothetical protein
MTSMLGCNRRRHATPKSRPRRRSLQMPNGVIGRRVQKMGGERFAIVCVDPAKHRSEWMMADYFGNLLIEHQTLPHQTASSRWPWSRFARPSSSIRLAAVRYKPTAIIKRLLLAPRIRTPFAFR